MSAMFDERRSGQDRHYRRGIYLLPSLFTIGNMFWEDMFQINL